MKIHTIVYDCGHYINPETGELFMPLFRYDKSIKREKELIDEVKKLRECYLGLKKLCNCLGLGKNIHYKVKKPLYVCKER